MPNHRTTPATVRAAGTALAAVLAVAASLLTTTPAVARVPNAQAQVDAFLAQHPDARKVGPRQVSWRGGDVVMTFADQAGVTSTCSSGWSCLYEHRDFLGRMLQFRDCGYTQSLGAYGFANMTTSWNNRRSRAAIVRNSGDLLWSAQGYTSSRYVGIADNDKADTIYLSC